MYSGNLSLASVTYTRGNSRVPSLMVTGLVGRLGDRSNPRYRSERRKYLDGDDGLQLWFHYSRSHRESAGDVVDSHVLQHVGCRLYWFVANLVDADRVPAVLANHGNAVCEF